LASTFQQTTTVIRSSKKIEEKKFENSTKNGNFHAEFKNEKLTANNFSQKSYKQKKGQYSSFLCFYSYMAIFYGV